MPDLDIDALRSRLASLPREVLLDVLGTHINPARPTAPDPDGSQVLHVPGPGGRLLAFRLSADDLRL